VRRAAPDDPDSLMIDLRDVASRDMIGIFFRIALADCRFVVEDERARNVGE
jgi:hypothetical protein